MGSVPIFQAGFTYIALLIFVAISGAAMAAAGGLWSHGAQREKERELLFAGNQYRQAIAAYYRRSIGGEKRFPAKLEDLLDDRRDATLRRHLRRVYPDPITGTREWGLLRDPRGGIMGVYSLSTEPSFKTGGFDSRDRELEGKTRYSDWRFAVVPD